MASDATRARPGPPGGGRAWLIWFLGASCFGYAFFHRVTPSVMVSDLMREFSVGAGVPLLKGRAIDKRRAAIYQADLARRAVEPAVR